jgi:hypothetical protein
LAIWAIEKTLALLAISKQVEFIKHCATATCAHWQFMGSLLAIRLPIDKILILHGF